MIRTSTLTAVAIFSLTPSQAAVTPLPHYGHHHQHRCLRASHFCHCTYCTSVTTTRRTPSSSPVIDRCRFALLTHSIGRHLARSLDKKRRDAKILEYIFGARAGAGGGRRAATRAYEPTSLRALLESGAPRPLIPLSVCVYYEFASQVCFNLFRGTLNNIAPAHRATD